MVRHILDLASIKHSSEPTEVGKYSKGLAFQKHLLEVIMTVIFILDSASPNPMQEQVRDQNQEQPLLHYCYYSYKQISY